MPTYGDRGNLSKAEIKKPATRKFGEAGNLSKAESRFGITDKTPVKRISKRMQKGGVFEKRDSPKRAGGKR